jgi:hypothetical protein
MPSAYNLHPEFGYSCLSPNLRRKAGSLSPSSCSDRSQAQAA